VNASLNHTVNITHNISHNISANVNSTLHSLNATLHNISAHVNASLHHHHNLSLNASLNQTLNLSNISAHVNASLNHTLNLTNATLNISQNGSLNLIVNGSHVNISHPSNISWNISTSELAKIRQQLLLQLAAHHHAKAQAAGQGAINSVFSFNKSGYNSVVGISLQPQESKNGTVDPASITFQDQGKNNVTIQLHLLQTHQGAA